MEKQAEKRSIVVGIDVSKANLDVAMNTSEGAFRYANTATGHQSLIAAIAEQAGPALVVMEASGGYERACADALTSAGLAVAVVNPRQVRDYARSLNILAKTDRIDASVLVRFGVANTPDVRPLPSEASRELSEWVQRRKQLVAQRVQEKNRLEHASDDLRADIEAHVTWLTERIDDIETRIQGHVETNDELKDKHARIKAVPGIGDTSASALLAALPEIGTLNNKEVASLAGLAPFNRDSGSFRGKRTIKGGRVDIRTALYMSTLVATRHNPVIKAFYDRLLDAGKAKKLALTACARKLLCILNAMIRNNTDWQPNLST